MFPTFQRARKEHNCDRRLPTWALETTPSITFFVMLQPFDGRDEFAIEVAWSDDCKFPWEQFGSLDIVAAKCRGRLSRLWSIGKVSEVWEVVPRETPEQQHERIESLKRKDFRQWRYEMPVEEAIPRVQPLVADAINKFAQYGIPLFRSIADRRGVQRNEL
jgi:hypothetical protein